MQSIDFQGITFVADKALCPIPIEVLASVESRLGFTFPDDYREFITTIGAGHTEFHLRIWPPQMIVDDFLREAQDRLAECWFWDDSPEILTQAQAVECVPLFGSDDGDEVLFHPSDRSRWFLLQHDVEDETVIVVRSFQEVCRFYLQRYEELQEPYGFEVWTG
jgi:hypothetical protein